MPAGQLASRGGRRLDYKERMSNPPLGFSQQDADTALSFYVSPSHL